MIRAQSLTRTYGDLVAVNHISFEIKSKEIVGLLGHNGAGKTTIMKMITGYLEPSSGNIAIDDTDVWSNRSAIQQQIGYLPENCPLYSEMTVLDYLDYAANLRGVPQEKTLERIGYVIEKTNLISVARKSIDTLSRGYRQRLGVAQAIIHSPNILVLDEPTNGLDPSQILEMRSLIKELAETATIVISTHILQEVQAICSRVIIINSGKMALDAAMADIQHTSRLKVVTDCKPDACAQMLTQLKDLQIIKCEQKEPQYTYIIDAGTQEASESAAIIAQALVTHTNKVFAIHPIVRDLEGIFNEITAGGTAGSQTEGNGRGDHLK